MQRALITALCCVGCYSPSVREGGACTTTCPGDLVCIDHICHPPDYMPVDAAVTMYDVLGFDGPPGDQDGDGLVDMDDNCPLVANADQHDEDTDAFGDSCDPCPHLAGGGALDSDGDGVGDACDPDAGAPKQTILFFDTFAASRAEWTLDPGATRVGETLRLLPSSLNANDAYSELDLPTGELRITVGGTIVSTMGTASSPHGFAVAFGFNAGQTDYYYAEFYDTGAGTGQINLERADSGSFTDVDAEPYVGVLPSGAWSMRIDESVASQQIALQATLGGTAYPAMSGATTGPALIASNMITMFSENADVRIDYVLVVKTTP